MIERYFDNAATTPVDPRVVEEMLPYFSEGFGNANSIHEPGQRARAAVELARGRLGSLLEAEDSSQVFFTSGATEANNWIAQKSGGVICSPLEHTSMLEAITHSGGGVFQSRGHDVYPSTECFGTASIMLVNNETGGIVDATYYGRERKLHRDITQAIGKISVDEHYDSASLSAHKFYGPKGVGALHLRDYELLEPLLFGGEHEYGLRAGTLNVPGIVGMGAAAAIALQEADKNKRHAESLRALVLDEITKTSDIQLNSPANSSPYIVSLSFLGVEGETLVVELDRAGYSISSGAACSSRSTEPSHVLMALGLPMEWIRGTIRISFGKYNTEEAAINLAKELRKAVEKLRTMN